MNDDEKKRILKEIITQMRFKKLEKRITELEKKVDKLENLLS
jgi:tetrahydromethanopterin S-methyltransferase subunit G